MSKSWEELGTKWEGTWVQEPLLKRVTLGQSLSLLFGVRMIMTVSAPRRLALGWGWGDEGAVFDYSVRRYANPSLNNLPGQCQMPGM